MSRSCGDGYDCETTCIYEKTLLSSNSTAKEKELVNFAKKSIACSFASSFVKHYHFEYIYQQKVLLIDRLNINLSSLNH